MNNKRILVIDNYDSFTYNLVQYVGEIESSIYVYRNDKIDIEIIQELSPWKIILSPGPGNPEESGVCPQIIQHFSPKVPILGICLGHQVIGYTYGREVSPAPYLMHGKTSEIFFKNDPIFKNVSNPFIATRYHSLSIKKQNFSDDLEIIAYTQDKVIMACRHKKYQYTYGIQFHPESILTQYGKQIIQNFLKL
nr:anthranilate synthase component 2 [Cavernulicola chilensis]